MEITVASDGGRSITDQSEKPVNDTLNQQRYTRFFTSHPKIQVYEIVSFLKKLFFKNMIANVMWLILVEKWNHKYDNSFVGK